jgi:hypothetical protein
MNIILGQGLAGTVLAFRLLERGEEVRIIDDQWKSSSSMVAAGLWNPIVFRRINKSWKADECIAELDLFYPSLEDKLKAKFYRSVPIWRIHGSKQEQDLWDEKKDLPGFRPYLFPGQS